MSERIYSTRSNKPPILAIISDLAPEEPIGYINPLNKGFAPSDLKADIKGRREKGAQVPEVVEALLNLAAVAYASYSDLVTHL